MDIPNATTQADQALAAMEWVWNNEDHLSAWPTQNTEIDEQLLLLVE